MLIHRSANPSEDSNTKVRKLLASGGIPRPVRAGVQDPGGRDAALTFRRRFGGMSLTCLATAEIASDKTSHTCRLLSEAVCLPQSYRDVNDLTYYHLKSTL